MDIAAESSFRHTAFAYRGDEQYIRGVAGFVAEGVRAGEAVLVAVPPEREELLRGELAQYDGAVTFLDPPGLDVNPGRLVPMWQDWADRNKAGGRGFRGVCEQTLVGRGETELVECRRNDHLLGLAFEQGPPWSLMCPFDADALPEQVVSAARAGHPLLLVDGECLNSSTYVYPDAKSVASYSTPLSEPEAVVAELPFDVDSLAVVREVVRRSSAALGLSHERLIDFTLVASELATNSILYGSGSGTLRVWREGAYAVCEVRDCGTITDLLVGLRRPDFQARPGGAGLWAIHQVSSVVSIRSAPGEGTVVRALLALEA